MGSHGCLALLKTVTIDTPHIASARPYLVGITVEDRVVRSLGESFRLNVGTQNHHPGWVDLDLDLGLGAQYSVVDFLVQVLAKMASGELDSFLDLLIPKTYLNPVAGGGDQTQLAQGNGHVRGSSVGSSVHERDGVRVERLVDRCDRAGPDFDALVLLERGEIGC